METVTTSRMQAVQSPVIPIVGELIRSFPGTISLGQGVVYYPPPPEATNLTQFFADPANHQYKAIEGIPPLIAAIKTKLQTFNDIALDKRCIMVTAGSNMGFLNALLAITSVGDEVILQTPYYFNHEMAIQIAGCHPVFVATDENYQLRPEAIAQAITEKTKAVVTISPNNPTGAVYAEDALRAVNQLCRDRGIYHISDEAYEYFTYDGVKHVSPGAFSHSHTHTISLYSLSKAYGFASWRIGYMVIPEHLLVAIKKVQDTNLICPPVISQYAALGALQTGFNYCQSHIQAIANVRQVVLHSLNALQGLCTIAPANGAFYFFLKVHAQLDPFELTERLIREHRVAVLPGTAFGMDRGCYLRVAYGALQEATAKEGMERLVKGLQTILAH
ncbi:pyridoxal phosphate-dependent aminotransferase [Gloeocapsa sp. PCC 7428]|uniref:pyridoxal phosphate-dependent aminotransferase n=1 Tax=Gloeocapsa sp. PCC 7428 TaxID=1173026 RepID=UPI0005A51BEB|nr:pyridoxal phosphate-dependent aminotransferase [Gloeocapsa sp. PCC 7428]